MREYKSPIFTEKHYFKIAQIIGDELYCLGLNPEQNSTRKAEIAVFIDRFISAFEQDNSKFKESLFMKEIQKVKRGEC